MSQEQDRVYIDKQDPGAYQALVAVATQVTASAAAAGLDRRLVELVNLRVSQLNRCAFCLTCTPPGRSRPARRSSASRSCPPGVTATSTAGRGAPPSRSRRT